jgi:hypothetical protein
MKISAIILIIIASGLSGFIYFKTTQEYFPASQPVFSKPQPDDNLLLRLAQENSQLKRQIVLLEESNKKLHSKINLQQRSQTNNLESQPETNAQNNVGAYEYAEHHLDQPNREKAFHSFLEKISDSNPKETNAVLSNKFNSETIDYAWATEREIKLNGIFSTDPELSKFVPEDIRCKTTQCQIKIPISDYLESNQVMESMSKAFRTDEHNLKDVVITTIPDISAGFVDFYVSRDANVMFYQ